MGAYSTPKILKLLVNLPPAGDSAVDDDADADAAAAATADASADAFVSVVILGPKLYLRSTITSLL